MKKNKTQIVNGVDRYIGISYIDLRAWLLHHINKLHTPPEKIIELMLNWTNNVGDAGKDGEE